MESYSDDKNFRAAIELAHVLKYSKERARVRPGFREHALSGSGHRNIGRGRPAHSLERPLVGVLRVCRPSLRRRRRRLDECGISACGGPGGSAGVNRRFLQLMSHHLVEPTPVRWRPVGRRARSRTRSAWFARLLLATSLVQDLAGLERLACQEVHRPCAEQAHPEQPDPAHDESGVVKTVFEAEGAALMPYRGRFDGFHAVSGCGVEDLPCAPRPQPSTATSTRLLRVRSVVPWTSTTAPTAAFSDALWACAARQSSERQRPPTPLMPGLAERPASCGRGSSRRSGH